MLHFKNRFIVCHEETEYIYIKLFHPRLYSAHQKIGIDHVFSLLFYFLSQLPLVHWLCARCTQVETIQPSASRGRVEDDVSHIVPRSLRIRLIVAVGTLWELVGNKLFIIFNRLLSLVGLLYVCFIHLHSPRVLGTNVLVLLYLLQTRIRQINKDLDPSMMKNQK